MNGYVLYGTPHSLYTGKARSYLIKQHIDFEERIIGDPRYGEEIAPKIGRQIIPVVQAPDGTIIQDGTDIIDYFETHGLARQSAYPDGARQHVISLIFELFGGEGLLRPAMHYRWSFDETNLDFLLDQFGRFIFPQMAPDERKDITLKAMGRMRMAAFAFGVVPETFDVIEEGYLEFLEVANAHFLEVPYLLGGAPTIGDYGLIAPLFAHLGRDPYPAQIMSSKAPALYRWVERMNRRRDDFGEFIGQTAALPDQDALPPTLVPLLQLVARDYMPEVRAFVAHANQWLSEQADLKEGDVVGGAPKNRTIGMTSFEWKGKTLNVAVLPYRFYLLQRVQDAFEKLNAADQASVQATLTEAGLEDILTLKTARRVERENNVEVWGANVSA